MFISSMVARASLRIHRDQRGTISIVSVFAVLMLTILLGMVMNVGRHADSKIRMQNAADAAAYSGGVVVARGMNALAFSNRLLFDVFAMTAFMREARDRNGEPYTPDILAAWANEGPKFTESDFPKFERLGQAIVQKVPREHELVRTYGVWAAASSQRILPLMEEILQQELIPRFQRAVVEATADIAQTAAMEVALRHGGSTPGRGPMTGVLWRASGMPISALGGTMDRVLPVVDPVMDAWGDQAHYQSVARRQRRQWAVRYLADWNRDAMVMFDYEAKMCQFGRLWRHFTCAQLNQLLDEEYPDANLPHVIRTETNVGSTELERDYCFVCVVYQQKLPEMLPGLFRNPIDSSAVAYAQVRVFVPRRRIVWYWVSPGQSERPVGNIGGHQPPLPPPDDQPEPGDDEDEGSSRWVLGPEPGMSEQWNLLNQRWSVQLVPATLPALSDILQTVPPIAAGGAIQVPNLGSLRTEDIGRISPH
jgi:hypothetical protein